MSDRNPGLIADPVFLALTRPPMRWGVTYSALLACSIVSIEGFLVTRNLAWLLLYLPLHGLCYLLCLREPRIFDLLLLWGRTRGPGWLGNVAHWRANSYSPLALDLPDASGRRRAAPRAVVGGAASC